MNARNKLLRDLSVESFAILPHNFIAKGYRASVVNPHGLGFTVKGDCAFLPMPGLSCGHVPLSVTTKLAKKHKMPMKALAQANYADLLVLLGVMRASPYALKEIVSEHGPWKEFLDHSAGTTFRQWAELKALPTLSHVDDGGSRLNIFMNTLPHEPYFMGEDCRPRRTRLKVAPEEVQKRGYKSLFALQHAVAARCALLLVADYFDWMRKAGVYDNTKIVIVSDHGIVGTVEDNSSRAVAGGTTGNAFVRSRSVLFVKERGATGPLTISEGFLPNAEVPRIVCEEIGGCVNPYLDNKPIAALGRDVPFYVDHVPWQFTMQEPTRFVINESQVLTRPDPYDVKAWKKASPK